MGLVSILLFSALISSCSHIRPKTDLTCNGIDWWEAGRTDGVIGLPLSKLQEYKNRCENAEPTSGGATTVAKWSTYEDLYKNGREAGLVDYCTPQQGVSAGRAGLAYDNVCPENLEHAFISAYAMGARIRALENQDIDLEMRIDGLVRLLDSNQAGSAVRAQLDQLRDRRAQISDEISKLESPPNKSVKR